MKKWTAKELREKWLKFYEDKGHKIIPSASVIPENDPSVLFTTAGMHPLVPYLLGQPHPAGVRLADVQKCIRTGDIDSVGDNCHLTFFEMLGCWSLGDYFKEQKVAWSYEFLTSPEYLGLNRDQFAVTCFAGNDNIPKDEECAALWEKQGVPKDRIFFLGFDENFWQINRGPCGPDSEMFLDTGKPKCSENCNPSCICGKYMEIGNDVYMQYNRVDDDKYIDATQKNVDCGFGLERNLMVLNGVKSIYLTELFENTIKKLEELSGKTYNDDGDEWTRSFRIVCDHIRTATAILGDDKAIVPSNTDAGYILRRLIRRAINHTRKLGIAQGSLGKIALTFVEYFKDVYPEFEANKDRIVEELEKEENKFGKTIEQGMKEFQKVINGLIRKKEFIAKSDPSAVILDEISGKAAFRLYETFGFPLEMTRELAEEWGYTVDEEGFKEAFKQHQELARAGSEQHFKGGLAEANEVTTRMHTATHLMLAGLRKVLGDNVYQRGSNTTVERIRFDFSYDKPMTPEEIKQVEDFVNDAIAKGIEVERKEMPLDQAKASGALGIFDNKYGDIVSVYKIGDVSHEICGGPHVKNTAEIGKFKIIKEQSVSAGARRIRAVIE